MAEPLPVSLLPDSARLVEHDTLMGGVSLLELARTYGTPLFVYDEATLRARAREAAEAFDEGVAFASKSFLCAAMARLAVQEGLCIDVATGGELDLVLRAGVSASRVIMHGNNKSVAELEAALAVGVHRIVVDNFDEIARLTTLVDASHPLACLVRVTPGVEAHTHEFVRTGQEDTKFGFSIASGDARLAIDRLGSMAHVRVHGVHAHIGSQIFEMRGFEETLAIIAEFVRDDDFDELCVGGGLGVAYVAGESAPSISQWGAAVRAAARRVGIGEHVRLLAEPGRAIVAQAAVTLYRVGAVKPVAARTYMAVDGGMSDNPRPVLYGSGYEAFDVADPLAERPRAVRLVGKHCESGDVLIDEAWLPEATGVDSIVATPVTGAYGYAMASTYNRVPRPAVVFVADGAARLVLRRETFDDLARLEVDEGPQAASG
ncbi:MAG TPA: diaminopimelate decarboxylase [Acidimicrobiales bacterium]|nr:diaminopimelate decarboxylase [Acidimicrobiales bacterium]